MFQIDNLLEDPSPDQTQPIIPPVGLMEPGSLNRSSNVVEAIRNEIDKERIRKEIIAEESSRKQMLELEVQRELMMEREIAMFGGDIFASFCKNQADSVLFNEKMGMGVSAVSGHDINHFSEVPFHHRAVEPIISSVNQSPKVEILQVQPPSVGRLLLICTTSQYGLNDHFQGRKHKRKLSALREHKDDKNCSIGLFQRNQNLCSLMECPCDDLISWEKLEEGSSATNDNDPPSLLTDDSENDLGKNAAHEKQDNREFTF